MGVMMGPNGQLINTSNIGGGALGSNLIPNITPNIGALSKIDKSVTNDDGTITLPTIELQTNDPGLEAGQLQNLYGTDLMPYYNWVEAKQTGTMTYDPAEELSEINDDFMEKHGITAQEAAAQMQAAQERAVQQIGGATAAKIGSAFVQSKLGDASTGQAVMDAAGSVVPFKGLFSGPQAPVSPQGMLYDVNGSPMTLNTADAANLSKFSDVKLNPNQPAQTAPKVDAMTAGLNRLKYLDGGAEATITDRLYGSSAAGANLKMTGAAAGLDFITQVAMGADPMDAAKDAGKTAVLSYVANAIIPGSGPIVGFLSKFF